MVTIDDPTGAEDGAKVVPLGAEFKPPPDGELMLVPPPGEACQHDNAQFEVDIRGGRCICKNCRGEVSPFFVLERLMRSESLWQRHRRCYVDDMQRLSERSRAKCQHCQRMTRIRL